MSYQNPGGFGIYVHWPYCESKCPYCDFNSHVGNAGDHKRWIAAFRHEIARYADEVGGRTLSTIYFGGGTPSLMHPDIVASVIEQARQTWRTVNDLEVTLEANPGSVEAAKFAAFRAAGVNRVSLGVQALNDEALRMLGRRHGVSDALRALDIAKTNFDRVSFDLIYARQGQTLAEWEEELSKALDLAGDHLSLYQLTIEEGTAFYERAARGGLSGLPTEDLSADMFELTQDLCVAAGLPGYEVSNHARPGAESRHNLIYWRGGEYVGVGPGAHGRLDLNGGRNATVATRNPGEWLGAVEAIGSGEATRERLAPNEIALEYLLMSLRTSEGLDLARHEQMSKSKLNPDRVDNLLHLGLLQRDNDRLSTTPAGRLVLNAILRELAADPDN